MMRTLLIIASVALLSGCAIKSHNPEARLDIRASEREQVAVFESVKKFGVKNGFILHFRNDLEREGRRVIQLRLDRADGTAVVMDNFMSPTTIVTIFYAEEPEANWRWAKDALSEEIRNTLNGRGEIIEVPVGPPNR